MTSDMTSEAAAPPTQSAAEPVGRSHFAARTPGSMVSKILVHYGILWVLIGLMIVSQILYPGFFDAVNLRNLLGQNSALGIVALGMTFAIVAGGFDLSAGAIVGASTVVAAKLTAHGVPFLLVAVATIAAGVALGVINAVLITVLNVNAFIATLGSASIYAGGVAAIFGVEPTRVDDPALSRLGRDSSLGLPNQAIVMIVLFLVGGLVLARTVYGRSVYAVGGNAEAARLAGMRVKLVRASTYLITGGCAALTGLIMTGLLGLGQASTGSSLTFDAIIAVIIGGTSLFGGDGAVWRTAVGVALLAVIDNLFDLMALSSDWQQLIKGSLLVSAVAVDASVRRRH